MAARRSAEVDLRGDGRLPARRRARGLPAERRARRRGVDPDRGRRVAERRRRRFDRALRVASAESLAVKVARINVTPVKGLGLHHPDEVELTARGVETNRRFYLISGWRLFNGKDHGPLVRIAPSVENGRLAARLSRRPRGRRRGRARRGGVDELLGPAGGGAARDRAVVGRAVGLRGRVGAARPHRRAGHGHRRARRHDRLACVVRAARATSSPPKSTRAASGCCSSSTGATRTRKTRWIACGSARRSCASPGRCRAAR